MNYKNAFQFDGKIALVAGAGGVIGREISRGFAQCGAAVAAVDINLAAAQETVAMLGNNGREHIALCADITNLTSVLNLVESVTSIQKRIDFLINYAKLNIRKPAIDISEQEWDQVIDCNLKGTFLASQAVGRVKIQSKGGILQLTKVLAHEWAEKGITVNAVGPGYFKTNHTMALVDDPEKYEMIMSRIPMRWLGEINNPAPRARGIKKGATAVGFHELVLDYEHTFRLLPNILPLPRWPPNSRLS
jgi:NAD(P)-dependent dehydrogenase (short-subunit alcohol dehydrogenase family)